MNRESWGWLFVATPCWHMACTSSSSLKIESLLIIISLKNKWYYLIHKFNSLRYININSKKTFTQKIEQPWCHVTSQCALQLHSNFCDYVIINIVEKYNSHFSNQSQNPICVVVISFLKNHHNNKNIMCTFWHPKVGHISGKHITKMDWTCSIKVFYTKVGKTSSTKKSLR